MAEDLRQVATSFHYVAPGGIIEILYDGFMQPLSQPQPAVVLREISYREYVDYLEANGYTARPNPAHGRRFYEVSVD